MRLFKLTFTLTFALWYEPNWLRSFRQSWRRRAYWLAKRPRQLTLGPLRFDYKLDRKLESKLEGKTEG